MGKKCRCSGRYLLFIQCLRVKIANNSDSWNGWSYILGSLYDILDIVVQVKIDGVTRNTLEASGGHLESQWERTGKLKAAFPSNSLQFPSLRKLRCAGVGVITPLRPPPYHVFSECVIVQNWDWPFFKDSEAVEDCYLCRNPYSALIVQDIHPDFSYPVLKIHSDYSSVLLLAST